MTKKVFVAGATGVVGRRAVERLAAAGHQVTGIARSAGKAERLRSIGATPVDVSLFDGAALAEAVAGHDVVVNLATRIPRMTEAARPGAWAENDRIRSEGSSHLVDAAIAAGADTYVQESITFTYPDRGDDWIDEGVAVSTTKLVQSVNDAEAAAARFTAEGGRGVVLRFGLFHAADAHHTVDMVAMARRGLGAAAGRPDAYQSSIHADDAADAVVAALDAPAGVYNVVDDEPVTKREYARILGEAIGRRNRPFPGRLALLGGQKTSTLTRSQRVSNARFKEATGWAPRYRSVRESWPAIVAEIGPPPARPWMERLVRPVLAVLALTAVSLGLQGLVAPRWFYENFPFGRGWIEADGPYNQHLVTDFAGLNLAMAVVLVAAFMRPERFLVRTAALASMVFAVPHFTYHAFNLEPFGTGDAVANMVLLALAVLGPAVLVLGTAEPAGSVEAASGT